MRLSIIIPYYNKEKYIGELLECLIPQMVEGTEIVIVDDGSKTALNLTEVCTNIDRSLYEKCTKVIRKENGGVSSARNMGIENSSGEYISFIDADDLVSKTFVKDILDRIPFDYLDMSWKSMDNRFSKKLNTVNDKLDNPSVCTRAFSREFIGSLRFNTNKDGAEDEEFTRKLHLEKGKRAVITEYSYFYRMNTENSATNRYLNGGLNTRRIIYNYRYITKDMSYLIEEIQEEDKKNEVIVMCERNDLPELSEYCKIEYPHAIRGMELRGEPTPLFSLIPMPVHTQVVIWTDTTYAMGGIETFIYNFCYFMKDYYDITVLYRKADVEQLSRLSEIVQTIRLNTDIPVFCDTLIVNRLADKTPENIHFGKKIQMCHTCKINSAWRVPTDNNEVVYVSDVARKSFGKPGRVINNLVLTERVEKPLILLSATRLNTFEKGEYRMIQLARLLRKNEINFIWFIFSESKIESPVEGMVCLNPTLDIFSYMAMADYVVQLSDSESFGYTIVEALDMGIPVLTTPIDVLSEIGFEDGENGYILPFDMQHIDVNEIAECKLAGFKYKYNNRKVIKEWRDLLGDTKPKGGYEYKPIKVRIKTQYYDVVRQESMRVGTECLMLPDRAYELRMKGLVE